MIIQDCTSCGTPVEGKKFSAKRRCHECHKAYAREYAHDKYLRAIADGTIYKYRKTAREFMTKKNAENPAYRLMARARGRAAISGLDFDLTPEDITIPEVCPILKTPFEYKTYYTASLDRVDNSIGYVKGNVQVLSHKANAMKNSATTEELIKFAHWILENVTKEPKVNEA